MAAPKVTDETLDEAKRLVEQHGKVAFASRATGIPYSTLERNYKAALARPIDPAVQAAMDAVGTKLRPKTFWAKTDKDGNVTHSVMLGAENTQGDDFLSMIRDALENPPANRTMPPRFADNAGRLMVLDPSDVHIGKLCIASETGYTYDIDTASHRLVEGSRLLLESGKALGVTRVLFVVGNDIAHIDTPRRQTTSGTPQDTDGGIFSIYRAASQGYRGVVTTALEMGLSVDILFCPSNHDWVLGFCIVQELAAWFRDHPNFSATEYNISERHRKYYRFGNNLMMFTHADGAKENDLPQIMLVEARQHIAECLNRYGYLHHFHHKMKRALGVRPMQREKDHIAITINQQGGGAMEGDNLNIEYVRSPSPPDGWHDRNGYLNRQAVEAFIHDAHDGRKYTLQEWF